MRSCGRAAPSAQPDAAALVREAAKAFLGDYARITSYDLGLISGDELEEAEQR